MTTAKIGCHIMGPPDSTGHKTHTRTMSIAAQEKVYTVESTHKEIGDSDPE